MKKKGGKKERNNPLRRGARLELETLLKPRVWFPKGFVKQGVNKKKTKADDKKWYTATIQRHRAVQQNTPRFFYPDPRR